MINVNTLLDKIKPHVTLIDKTDDYSFDFNNIYADIIEIKRLHGSCTINKIPYEGKIKKDFYQWVLKTVVPEYDWYPKKKSRDD
jgi:hypothetical protein